LLRPVGAITAGLDGAIETVGTYGTSFRPKGKSLMPDATGPSTPSAEIGGPPYYHRSDCNICRKQDGLKTGKALLDVPAPGGYVVEDEHFLVEHAPLQESSAGTLIVEARRHFLDFGDMAPTESAQLGSILHRLIPAIKTATGSERVYYLAVMEHSPHFHLWLVPRIGDGQLRGLEYLAQQPPLTASYSAAEEMVRKIRAGFDGS
jgi:diadenosine tetraphosphate (Ap4A) HIT family hydrolase